MSLSPYIPYMPLCSLLCLSCSPWSLLCLCTGYSTSYMPISCYVPITTPVFHPLPIYKLPLAPIPPYPIPPCLSYALSWHIPCYISCAMIPLMCTMLILCHHLCLFMPSFTPSIPLCPLCPLLCHLCFH